MSSSIPQPGARRLDILIAGPLPAELMTRLEADHATTKLWLEGDPQAFLARHGARFDVLATSGVFGADAVLMGRLPNLRLVASFGVGTDPIDLAHARSRGVQVTNTPDVLNACVADAALGLLIALARRIVVADLRLRAGDWAGARLPLGTRLGGKVCGIVGLGGIGREIAQRVSACGMLVAYHGRRRQDGVAYDYHASLVELAHAADVLVLSLPATPETHHLVDAEILGALGPSGMLVNVARGSIVDERALVEARRAGTSPARRSTSSSTNLMCQRRCSPSTTSC